MKMLQTGDKCPICGQPIQTTDPNKLILISAIGWFKEQKDCGTFDLCAGTDSGATNADKLRSLPDEEIEAVVIGCPGTEFGGVSCYEIDPDAEQHEIDCDTCTKNWLKAPYTGWNNEKKS